MHCVYRISHSTRYVPFVPTLLERVENIDVRLCIKPWRYFLFWRSKYLSPFLIIKPTRCTNFSNLFLEWKYVFRTVPLSIIRSFSLHTQQGYMSYRFVVCTVKTPDDGQRNCPKYVEFNSKNKFEKLVHPVGFILRNFTPCTVTWTSKPFRHFRPECYFSSSDDLVQLINNIL